MILNMDHGLFGVSGQGGNLNVPQEEMLLNIDRSHKALVAKQAILMCHKKKCY